MALFVLYTIQGINLVLMYGGALLGVFCVIDAAMRRPDAFVAADKLTKATWFGIVVACGVVLGLSLITPIFAPQSLLWLVALIGVMVYLCDVRPNVKRVTGGNRW